MSNSPQRMIFQDSGFQFFQAGLEITLRAADVEIDTKTLNRVLELQKLPDDLKDKLYYFIDITIRDFKAKQAYAS